jgi:hypothetical protein
MVAFMSKKCDSKIEIAAAGVSGQAQRLSLFGPPLLLVGEDAAAYDELVGRICAAVRPADVIFEMFIADIVASEWEVLRWRRLKSILMQEAMFKALKNSLVGKLDYHLYSERVADRLTKILQDNLPEEQVDSAQSLVRDYARNKQHAVDTINDVLAGINLEMGEIQSDARAAKAHELVQGYRRGEPDAVRLVDQLRTRAGVSMETFMPSAFREIMDDIERIDRLIAIAETCRNAALREIDRRNAVLGEALRRRMQQIEDDDFADGELVLEVPAAEGNAA